MTVTPGSYCAIDAPENSKTQYRKPDMNLPIKNSPAYVIKSVAMGRDKYFRGVTAVSPEWTSPCHCINDQLHRLWIWFDVDSDIFWSGPCSFHKKKRGIDFCIWICTLASQDQCHPHKEHKQCGVAEHSHSFCFRNLELKILVLCVVTVREWENMGWGLYM